MKESFILYTSYMKHIELLDMEQRGILLTAIFAYQSNAELPDMDGMIKMAFSFIQSDMDKNEEKYQQVIEARREAGKKGGRPKANAFPEKQKKQMVFQESKGKQKNPVYEDVYVDDNVNNNKNILSDKSDRVYPYSDVISYLNSKAGTSFKDKSKDSRKHIKARFDEGYSLEDFKTVIDKKVSEWRGTKMEGFLRPATLFGTKFESYLNQRLSGDSKSFSNFQQSTTDWDAIAYQIMNKGAV